MSFPIVNTPFTRASIGSTAPAHHRRDDGPWEPEAVALEFADAMLNHWVFSRPGWLADTPEFVAGSYKGEYFQEHFQQW